jgi:hypothetical protein
MGARSKIRQALGIEMATRPASYPMTPPKQPASASFQFAKVRVRLSLLPLLALSLLPLLALASACSHSYFFSQDRPQGWASARGDKTKKDFSLFDGGDFNFNFDFGSEIAPDVVNFAGAQLTC